MSRKRWAAVGGLVALIVGGGALTVARHYLSTSVPDQCSTQYESCVESVEGIAGRLDCRIEVYHCRAFGEFTHPDGSVVRVPTGR
jgi:hypothetical protein